MNTQSERLLKNNKGLQKGVFVRTIFGKMGMGLKEATFLSQAMYWDSVKDCGWFCKSISEWREETLLTQNEIRTARDSLVNKRKYLSERYEHGTNKLWFKVDYERICDEINSVYDSEPLLKNQSGPLLKNRSATSKKSKCGARVPYYSINTELKKNNTNTPPKVPPEGESKNTERNPDELFPSSSESLFTLSNSDKEGDCAELGKPNYSPAEIVSMWNGLEFKKVSKLNSERSRKVSARLRSFSREEVDELFESLRGQSYLKSKSWFGFDFVFRSDSNFEKVVDKWMSWELKESGNSVECSDNMRDFVNKASVMERRSAIAGKGLSEDW